VSVDVADGGECETVVTVARHYDTFVRVLRIRRFSFPAGDAPILAADAAEKAFVEFQGRPGQDDFVVDSIGVGSGTAGTLRARNHKVLMHKGGDASTDSKRWRNMRAQSHFNARDALRDKMVVFDEDLFIDDPAPLEAWTEFYAQCCSIKTRLDGERVDDLIPKATMIKEGIASPDIAESFVMQFAGIVQSIEPGSVVSPPAPVLPIYSDITSELEMLS
jgi:hypothetical protein